jgi:hypothetical protein
MKENEMNRQQRRRQAAMAKQNKFVTDYVQHLPEVGPETIRKPGRVCHMVCYHDDDCTIYDGKGCNCDPDVKFFAEPERN